MMVPIVKNNKAARRTGFRPMICEKDAHEGWKTVEHLWFYKYLYLWSKRVAPSLQEKRSPYPESLDGSGAFQICSYHLEV